MNRYLVSGLIIGGLCALAYVLTAIRSKKTPALADVIQIVLSGVGTLGGFKIALFVLSGEFTGLIKTHSQQATLSISEDDTVYFFVGSVALVWVSVETIYRQFKILSLASPNAVQKVEGTGHVVAPPSTGG